MISDRLKGIIFKKLYSELSHLEIIEYKDEIWFIDREDKRWYFIYNTNGTMWWKYGIFCDFFEFFSITEKNDFAPILSSWVEEVLNCRVTTTEIARYITPYGVEEVLNCRVTTTDGTSYNAFAEVEDVLNYKVNRSFGWMGHPPVSINVVLNSTEK
jgi:hypothetical protein